jgi:GT2 family glycosyltransferase
MEKRPVAAVIVLNYHQDNDTEACLKSLSQTISPGLLEIVLVQIEADKDSDARFLSSWPKLHILHADNRGFSGGNNLGVNYALDHFQVEFLILLNNDTRVDAQCISELLSAAQQHSVVPGLFCPKIYFEKGREFHASSYSQEEKGHVLWYAGGIVDESNMYAWHRGVDEVDHGQFDREQQTGFATGCCMALSKETWEKIGKFDERYFLYLEDLDYSMRVLKQGGELWYVPRAVVWHKNAGSTAGSGSATQVYYQTRNRLVFGSEYGNPCTRIALVKESVKMMRYGNPQEKSAVRDFFLHRLGQRRT